jgi:hypothetical protein
MKQLTKKKRMRKPPYIMTQKKRCMWNIGHKKDTDMFFQEK